MKIRNKQKILFALLVVFCGNVYAQEFGFGVDDNSETSSSSPAGSLKISGDITVEMSPYIYDFNKKEDAQEISFWDMVSGTLKFSASGSNVEAIASFNLNADSISEVRETSPKLSDSTYTPLIMDEVFLRAYIGQVNIEAGLRKLTWGKMDSPGPLGVTNPMDYTDFRNITDTKAIKIARPMIHITWNTGSFSKLEGVFIPNLAGHRFASDGRWQPSQSKNMLSTAEAGISSIAEEKFGSMMTDPVLSSMLSPVFDNARNDILSRFDETMYPSTGALKYFQAGLRYTTTIGSADIGGQYFYGNMFRPSFTIAGIDAYLEDLKNGILGSSPPLTIDTTYEGKPYLISPEIKYNRYHQIGIDYAQVLLGFNVRAEFAANITNDLSGDDGSVYNPALLWSFGFDRDLFWGINLNLQCNESIRLMNSKIGNNPILDIEAGTDMTSTQIIAAISRKFFRDELELRFAALWGIEDRDFLLLPAFIWTRDTVSVELSGGIFGGNEDGQFGQYKDNLFVKAALTYSF